MSTLSEDQIHSLILEIQRSIQNSGPMTREFADRLLEDIGNLTAAVTEMRSTIGLGVGITLQEGNVLMELRELRRGQGELVKAMTSNAQEIAALRESQQGLVKEIAEVRESKRPTPEDIIIQNKVKEVLATQDRRRGIVEKALIGAMVACVLGLVAMGAVMWVRINAMAPAPAVIGKP